MSVLRRSCLAALGRRSGPTPSLGRIIGHNWVSSDEPRLGKKCPRYRSWVSPSAECGEDLGQPGRTGELDGRCGSWSEMLGILASGVLSQTVHPIVWDEPLGLITKTLWLRAIITMPRWEANRWCRLRSASLSISASTLNSD